jgi:hypothetical protein
MLQRRHWSSFTAEAGRGNPVNLQRYSSLHRAITLLSEQMSRSASSRRNLAFWKIQSVVDSIWVQCDNYHPHTKPLPTTPLPTPPSSLHPLFLSSSYIIPSHISSPSSSALPPLPPAPPFSKNLLFLLLLLLLLLVWSSYTFAFLLRGVPWLMVNRRILNKKTPVWHQICTSGIFVGQIRTAV